MLESSELRLSEWIKARSMHRVVLKTSELRLSEWIKAKSMHRVVLKTIELWLSELMDKSQECAQSCAV